MKKNHLSIFLACILFPLLGMSQSKIRESTESIGDIKGNALSIVILRADEKDIQKEWKSIMKSYEGKVKTKGKTILTSDAKMDYISSGNVQINAEIGKLDDNKREFTVIFLSEKGAVSSSSDISAYTAAKLILQNFSKELSNEAVKNYHKEQEKYLAELKKEKENLQKSNEDLQKKIKEWKEDIIEAEKQIEENIKNQELNIKKLEKQQEVFESSSKEVIFIEKL